MTACLAAAALLAGLLSAPQSTYASAMQPSAGGATATVVMDAYQAASRAFGGYRDTGILLAGEPRTDITLKPMDVDDSDAQRAIEKHMEDADKRKFFTEKKGKKVADLTKSVVDDPNTIPTDETNEQLANVRTAWRTDKLREMTYTQFWLLTREGRIDKVKFSGDGRSVMVTTKDNAPGGRRTEKVGLPYDPDLMHHLVEHGVEVELVQISPIYTVVVALLRLAFPVWLAMYLVKFSFRLGRKQKRDKLFGGVRMEMIKKTAMSTTFDDVAGIDQVKAEIQEVVAFLRNPKRFLDLGARSPAGVLLVGPPGTGKTLLAKAIAGEAGVPFFSASGTEFMEMFVGVGASRVRDMFEKARKNSPCILFIDEFDGLGKQRSFGGEMGGSDESVHTINQLLTEMDGFEDNTGVVVMAATNRPASLDTALTRPGRFDRIIHLPLPNLRGRMEIMAVHSRDKKISPDVDFEKIARATAGFTGAQLMNLMNQAAITAVRQDKQVIDEVDLFDALEGIHLEAVGRAGLTVEYEDDIIPPLLRRQIAIYEAAKAFMGCITPEYDDLSKVSICPGGVPTSYTYFIPSEEFLETKIMTRAYMESRLVVLLAGRVAERLLLGDDRVSPAGAGDLEAANEIAREMIFRCGFSRRLGPVALMDDDERFINQASSRQIANISVEMAKIAREEVSDLLDGAETKAYYGIVRNYKGFVALVDALFERSSMSGVEVRELLEANAVQPFEGPMLKGYYWTEDGALVTPDYPPLKPEEPPAAPTNGNGAAFPYKSGFSGPPGSPYTVRIDMPEDFATFAKWPATPPKIPQSDTPAST